MKANKDLPENKETSHKTDSISNGDFYSNSRWGYYINEKYYYDSGASLEELKEEDINLRKIKIVFSLTGVGEDLDGTLKW